MTRASRSVGSNAVNSKAIWMSKLACRRDEVLDANEIEEHILSSNDSVELAFPILKNGKEMENYNRQKYSNVQSFPMCSIGCNRYRNNDGDETECSMSNQKKIFSKDWTCHSDHEANTDFGNIQIINKNDHSLDSNSKGNAHQSDNRQVRTVNREVLSPTLHLLHEVYMKKKNSNTGVYFLSNNRHHPTENDYNSHLEAIEKKQDKNAIVNEQNKYDSVQMERMIFRQQLRYEAIRKELFDNVTPSPFDMKSGMGNSEAVVRHKVSSEADSLIETAGCQSISFWNYIPSMSSLLLNVLPENDAFDDDSVEEGDLDEISYSVETTEGQSYLSSGTDTNSGSAEDKYNYHIPYTTKNQETNIKNEGHEDLSHCGASVDQSHIYLMMPNAGLKQARSIKQQQKHGESNSASGSTIDAKKISELTLDDLSVNPHIQTYYMENEETKLPDFGWTRHFQPFWEHQLDIDIRQSLWLNEIHDSFKDQNRLLVGAVSDQQLERRVAANEALQRIVQKRQQDSLNHLSTMVFDIWR